MSKRKKNRGQEPMPPLPEPFIRQMENLLGEEECAELAACLDLQPSVSIRLNRRKVKNTEEFMKRFAGYSPGPVPWCESGFFLSDRPDFIHDPLLHAGCYYVQEAGSMIYETIVRDILTQRAADGQNGHLNVLDLCAAPGGKSTAMLNALEGDYLLVANEFDRKRAVALKENLDKWGDPNVIITSSPTSGFTSLKGDFDIVAVDAPCSGEGMMRREPVARSQWSDKLVEQCASLQKEILSDAVEALKPGGFLIYSTCTFNRKENEENVELLKTAYALVPIMTPRHFYPHREQCEGLFVAAFRKPEAEEPESVPLSLSQMQKKLEKAKIRVISAGTEHFTTKGNVEIPSSRQVLSYSYDRSAFPEVDLSPDESLSYLRRNSLSLPDGSEPGYYAVCYEGYPLGLVKNIGTRANNLYPPEWRILT